MRTRKDWRQGTRKRSQEERLRREEGSKNDDSNCQPQQQQQQQKQRDALVASTGDCYYLRQGCSLVLTHHLWSSQSLKLSWEWMSIFQCSPSYHRSDDARIRSSTQWEQPVVVLESFCPWSKGLFKALECSLVSKRLGRDSAWLHNWMSPWESPSPH